MKNKPFLLFKAPESVSGYAQLTYQTLRILQKHFECLDLPLSACGPRSLNYEKINKNNESAPELIIASLPGDPYNTILSSVSSKKDCSLLTMWESTRLTGWHVRECESFRKIAVPSQWNVKCFESAGFNNIHKVPLFVDQSIFNYAPKKRFKNFIFVTGGSHLYQTGNDLRKDIPKIVRAFNKGFYGINDVELWIKLSAGDYHSFSKFLDPRIKVFSHIENQQHYANFLRDGDVFVSPSKSEGWGFMQIESLAVGRPLITPPYSGLTEFLTSDNHYPVSYAEKLASGNWGRNGGLWAEIDEDSLIEQMLFCYKNKDTIRHNYKNYSESVLPKFSTQSYEKNLLSFLKK